MPAYDTIRFTPPAPLALVTLRNSANGATVSDVPMLLDSGADVTLVPRQSVIQLNVEIDQTLSFELAGFDGRRSSSQAVTLDFMFFRKTFRGQFLLIDQECGILGRNILNHLSLSLDGPNLTWDERTSPAK